MYMECNIYIRHIYNIILYRQRYIRGDFIYFMNLNSDDLILCSLRHRDVIFPFTQMWCTLGSLWSSWYWCELAGLKIHPTWFEINRKKWWCLFINPWFMALFKQNLPNILYSIWEWWFCGFTPIAGKISCFYHEIPTWPTQYTRVKVDGTVTMYWFI